jgi:receptor protein-tyrosine kinase
VRNAALNAAKVPKDRRGSIRFTFSTSTSGDVITMGATARDPAVARSVTLAFRDAYVQTRASTYASALKAGAQDATRALTALTARLEEVKKELKKIDANLLASLPDSASGSTVDVVARLPSTTPIPTVLLVSEHQELLARIGHARKDFAKATTSALTPSSFATTVEVFSAVNVTPPLSSPVVPAAAILGNGLALALALPVLIDKLDKSIRTAKTAAVSFDSPVLTSVPASSRRVQRSLAAPGTPWDGAYRALAATSIATDRLPTAIVVTSPTGIVQDTVAANFAAALAGLGLRVALIATDARQAWFSETGETAEPGLGFPDLLELAHQGRLDGALPRGLLPTRVGNLRVLPPGPRGQEFSLDGFRPLLEALSTSGVDITVIAAPALLEDPNATILAWITRSVLWAFETGDVTEAEAKEAAARLALAGASSFGVAMVNDKT